MGQRTIISSRVENTPRGAIATVVIDVGEAGVKPVLHIFPLDALEWRAAEYGIDHTDVDLLLDCVLHEPYLTEDTVVHTAASPAAARVIHLERIAAAKAAGHGLRSAVVAGRKEDPLQPIRDAYAQFADADEVAAKGRHVEQQRRAMRARSQRRAAAGWPQRRPLAPGRPKLEEAPRA
ncbi:hypothetical protein ACFCYX_19590 [Streptomyces populi]|uniref:hypothetical protein n=1 Tax=Streptomyces populi TaxID=2058924 RepID=UPI0035D7E75C